MVKLEPVYEFFFFQQELFGLAKMHYILMSAFF